MKLFKQKSFFFFLLIVVLATILRLAWLDTYPASLYTDEADQGYNMYSVLMTGKDEHGVWLPTSFRSFGDWKPPVQTYLMAPFIYFLGLNEWSVRLPSAILGVLTVILTYVFILEILTDRQHRTKIALLASWFLAVSPWHILQSRSAMLVAVTLFFLELALYSWIRSEWKIKWLSLSAVSFVIAIYAYYGMRVIVPLIILYFIFSEWRSIKVHWKSFLLPSIVGLILLLPLIIAFIQQPDVVFGRARTVSIFYDQGVKLRQWELQTQDGIEAGTLVTRFFHNSPYMYGRDIVRRFFSHLDPYYVFFLGDQNQPFQISNMGILYLLDGIFILLGVGYMFSERLPRRGLIIWFFIVSFIPAALTFVTPASNRTFDAVLPYSIFLAIGLSFALSRVSYRVVWISISSFGYIVSIWFFLHQYFITMPLKHSDWWNWGWKQAVAYVKSEEHSYDSVVVFDKGGMPYIYFLVYYPVDPARYQKEAIRTYVSDRFGFEHVEGFGKYQFPSDWEWKYTKENLQSNTLYIVPAQEAQGDTNYIYSISGPDGNILLKFFKH